jgi:hypothetical protein
MMFSLAWPWPRVFSRLFWSIRPYWTFRFNGGTAMRSVLIITSILIAVLVTRFTVLFLARFLMFLVFSTPIIGAGRARAIIGRMRTFWVMTTLGWCRNLSLEFRDNGRSAHASQLSTIACPATTTITTVISTQLWYWHMCEVSRANCVAGIRKSRCSLFSHST